MIQMKDFKFHLKRERAMRRFLYRPASGFTLIELLIVVAIIAILAAIAVPNFLESQARAKVSRSKADIKSMTLALECYRVDNNYYPDGHWITSVLYQTFGGLQKPTVMSTPIAYLSSVPTTCPFDIWIDHNYGNIKFKGYLYLGGKYF